MRGKKDESLFFFASSQSSKISLLSPLLVIATCYSTVSSHKFCNQQINLFHPTPVLQVMCNYLLRCYFFLFGYFFSMPKFPPACLGTGYQEPRIAKKGKYQLAVHTLKAGASALFAEKEKKNSRHQGGGCSI